jgi:hypothetical protein
MYINIKDLISSLLSSSVPEEKYRLPKVPHQVTIPLKNTSMG